MTKAERLRRKKHFPANGNKLIEQILAASNGGQSPVNQRTIGAIIRGERGDKHGVIEIFTQITDNVKRNKERAIKELSSQLSI